MNAKQMHILASKAAKLFSAALLAVTSILLLPGGNAWATTTNSIYSYTLDGSSATVSNGAASNSSVDLTLAGDWSQSTYGVHFDGDLVSQQSVGYANPASGDTVDVPSTDAVGVATRFKFEAPPSGQCFNDSTNVTQIGRAGDYMGQIKIQLSNCNTNSTGVQVECRMAGANTPISVPAVRNDLVLVDGADYIAKCHKTPDASGNTTITLRVVKVDTTNGNTVETEDFNVTATGAITSTAYLSVANKYQLPTQSNNDDQFIGDIAKVAYCQAGSAANVVTCLDTEVAEPASNPQPTEWITNQDLETNMNGWTGVYGSSSLRDQSYTTDGYGNHVIKITALTGASGHSLGFNDTPRWVTNTTANTTYEGSVWVKPNFAGQTLHLRLREWNGNTLVTDDKVNYVAAGSYWQEITNDITAAGNGNEISFIVYGSNMYAGDWFMADDFSLVSN